MTAIRHSLAAAAIALVVAGPSAASAQGLEPPVSDTRLSVHTLVREDVFAGFQQDDVTRLARAERNLERLAAARPADRAPILAWQGAVALTHAVHANARGDGEQFRLHHRRAQQAFAEAMRLGPDTVGVFAVVGGSGLSLADRLPGAERTAAWEQAYQAYQKLWALQGGIVDKLPLHHKGELLAGLAQTAQRTGRAPEASVHVDRILSLMPQTPYAGRARAWKDDPSSRAGSSLACGSCHAPGTLAAQLSVLAKP